MSDQADRVAPPRLSEHSPKGPAQTVNPAPSSPAAPSPAAPPAAQRDGSSPARGAGVGKKPRPAKAPPRVDHLPPFKVLLHNDDTTEMEDVVRALVELTPLRVPEAVRVMQEAHESGVALVLVTHRERAELYCEQFFTKGLTATIEPT